MTQLIQIKCNVSICMCVIMGTNVNVSVCIYVIMYYISLAILERCDETRTMHVYILYRLN